MIAGNRVKMDGKEYLDMNNKNETTQSLSPWTAPHLLRLNQADGTDKHALNTSEVTGVLGTPTACGGYATAPSPVGGPGICGPS